MAVPSRGIRWQIKFKSQKGYDCEVNIYLEGFTGTPSQLTGGNVPVYFEEDDTENLLKAVRIKTGYISFIEETYGHWHAVFPSTNLDRYVEVLYNTHLVFRGFLQAQTFENEWDAGPREIQIPIISVLGVAQSIYFNPTALGETPGRTGSVLWHVGNELTVPFQHVIFPDTSGTDSKGRTIPRITFMEKLRLLNICPYNDQYDSVEHGTAATDLYSPCSLYQFLEGICNAYGWTLHEWEADFVFTKHDHTGNYLMKNMATIDWDASYTTLTPSALNLSGYISISSDQNTVSDIMPVSRVEMNFGTRTINKGEMDFERCPAYIRYWNSNGRLYYFLTPMSNEFGGNLLQTMNQIEWYGSNFGGRLKNDGCYIAFISQDKGSSQPEWEEVGKGILVQWNTEWASHTELFWVRLPYPAMSPTVQTLGPSGSTSRRITYSIELELAWAESYTSDYSDEYFKTDGHGDFKIEIAICNQDHKYLDALGYWNDNEIFSEFTIDGSTGKIRPIHRNGNEFTILEPIQSDSLFFVFRTVNNDNLGNHKPIFFKKIGWSPKAIIMFPELFERPVDRHFDSNNGSVKTVSVDQFLTPYRYSENLIGDDVTNAMFTEYPYMFTAQRELKIDSRHDLPENFYLRPYTYDGRSDWKILAIGFYPRNDEYKLTLHTY